MSLSGLKFHAGCAMSVRRASWVVATAIGVATGTLVARVYGARRGFHYAGGFAAATVAQQASIRLLQRRIGPERGSPADLLTLSRASCGAALAGLLATGIRDRTGPAGWLGWLATLLGATVSDWLDGPLARRLGPTRIGKTLDIEADSWLTLWSAAGAVRWGDLPPWCVLPPLLRYGHPALDLLGGGVPDGGGSRLNRLTGTAQMALIITALAPFRRRPSRRALALLAVAVSGSQGTRHVWSALGGVRRPGDR